MSPARGHQAWSRMPEDVQRQRCPWTLARPVLAQPLVLSAGDLCILDSIYNQTGVRDGVGGAGGDSSSRAQTKALGPFPERGGRRDTHPEGVAGVIRDSAGVAHRPVSPYPKWRNVLPFPPPHSFFPCDLGGLEVRFSPPALPFTPPGLEEKSPTLSASCPAPSPRPRPRTVRQLDFRSRLLRSSTDSIHVQL